MRSGGPTSRCVAAAALWLAAIGSLGAADPAALLAEGWQEYQFQSFDKATRLFDEAVGAAADGETRIQARTGIAMVAQFREQGRDLDRAEGIYREILKEGPTGERLCLVQSMLAECLASKGKLEEADRLWDAAVSGFPNSLLAQDALLRRTVAHLKGFDSEESMEAIRYLEARRTVFPPADRERPALSPGFDLLLGDFWFWRKDYARAREAYIRYVAVGSTQTTAYSQRASAIMRIARISEDFLNDSKTAGAYYRMLVEETPNDVRSYFSLEKAARYGAIAPDEVRRLGLYGVTDDILREIFEGRED